MTVEFDLKFENLYRIIVFALKANRSHPDVKKDWKWVIYIVFAHGTFFSLYGVLMYSTVCHEVKTRDFSKICTNGVLALIFNIITLKYIVMVVYQRSLKEVLQIMDQDYETAKSFSKEEQDVIIKYARKGQFIMKAWTCYAVITACLFFMKSLVLMLYYYIMDEFRLVHAYEITYPPFIEERKNDIAVYVVLYVYFIFYDVYATVMYIGFVPLVPIMVLHACGQIEVVTMRLMKLFDSGRSDHVVQRRIKDIIIHIQEIHCFVEKIKNSMVLFYELLLKSAVILIPVSGFQVLKSTQTGDFKVEILSVFVGTLTESGMPCFLGDTLLESSEKMRQAVYSCGWETHARPATRSLIKLLLLRTGRPVALNTLFRVISRDALTDVYHHAYAIFNLMNAMWD